MKKLLFAAAVLTVFSGAYSAQALIPGVPVLETEVGYGYNGAKDGIHSAHIEISPVSKVIVGAEYRHWNHGGNETDIYAKYKLGHVYLGLGNRNYYDRDAKVYGLLEGRTNVIGPLDGGLKLSSEEREYKVGLRLGLVPTSFDLDVNYTYYDRDKTSSEDGFGVGLNYHF